MKIALRHCATWFSAVLFAAFSCPALGAIPTVEQALKLTPVQSGIDYSHPTSEEAAKCKIKQTEDHKGWIVEGSDGNFLRKFVDTNGDNNVDQWSYYKDGLEVYRDIDSDFNGRPDQYRWFNTAGTRWGLDLKERGVTDAWKVISAEEVAAEVVAAIAARDVDRFARLMLTPAEVKSLGLGKARMESLEEKISKVIGGFKAMASQQKAVTPQTVWVQFSAGLPGVVPAGTDDSTKDLRVYENATAIVETGGKHGQVQIGTLIQVGDVWRLIDLPQPVGEGQADAGPTGFFFQASAPRREEPSMAAGAADIDQKLLNDLDALDRDAAKADTPEEQAAVVTKRINLLEQLAVASKRPEDRAMWLRQQVDTICAAVPNGACPDGADRLASLLEKLQKSNADKALAAYVKYQQITAAYIVGMQAPKADFAKTQADWLKSLEQYVGDYPTSTDAADAMIQLAIDREAAGQEDDAKKWYARIAKEFPDSPAGKKAAGALFRLDSVGKVLSFVGQSSAGKPIDLSKLRGKVVLVQYWAAWSAPAKANMAALKELANKYGRSFTIVGVNLDDNVKELNAYLAENPLPWPQIHEEGGQNSRLANLLGISTVPTMILIDQQGKVVNRNIAIADLETELKKLIR